MGEANKTMRLSIVSSNPNEITVAQFKKKADELGIDAAVTPVTLDDIANGDANRTLGNCVLWRLSSLGPSGNGAGYGLMQGRISINSSLYVMPEIGNKYFQQQLLAYSSLAQYSVPTFYVNSYEQLSMLIRKGNLHYPVVVKPVHGSSAQGVTYLADDEHARRHTHWSGYIAESYIENDGEWRVFVVGGVATGAMKKVAAPGKRFNLVTPGAMVHSETDDEIRDVIYDIATQAASLFHTELNGVDIVRDSRTGAYYIFEVNVSPGWQNRFDKTTREDIPARVMEWFSERFDAKTISFRESLGTYITRRSHRLPLVDELYLLDLMFDYSSSVSFRMSVQEKRILGRDKERIRHVLATRIARGDCCAMNDILRTVDVIARRYGYKPQEVVGEENWFSVTNFINKMVDQDAEAHQFDRQYLDLVGLSLRLGIRSDGPVITADETAHDWSSPSERVSFCNGLLLHGLIDEAEPLFQRTHDFIMQNFFMINMTQKLEFLFVSKSCNFETSLEDMIMQHASTMRSWAGNFIVDDKTSPTSTGISTIHTLQQAYYASALYYRMSQ